MKILNFLIVSLFFGVLGGFGSTIINNHFVSKSFAVVDVDKVLSKHIITNAQKELSPDEMKAISSAFAEGMEKAIREASDDYKIILLRSSSVVSNLPDYTDYIEAKIEIHMQN